MRGTVQVPDHEYGVDYVATFESCRDCRTEFQRPMPSGDQLSSFYSANYHSMADGGFLLRLRHEMRIRRLRALLGGAGGVVLELVRAQPKLVQFSFANVLRTSGSVPGALLRGRGETLPDVGAEAHAVPLPDRRDGRRGEAAVIP